jgi:hypothetical protein
MLTCIYPICSASVSTGPDTSNRTSKPVRRVIPGGRVRFPSASASALTWCFWSKTVRIHRTSGSLLPTICQRIANA